MCRHITSHIYPYEGVRIIVSIVDVGGGKDEERKNKEREREWKRKIEGETGARNLPRLDDVLLKLVELMVAVAE